MPAASIKTERQVEKRILYEGTSFQDAISIKGRRIEGKRGLKRTARIVVTYRASGAFTLLCPQAFCKENSLGKD
jgi:hypothetical protein